LRQAGRERRRRCMTGGHRQYQGGQQHQHVVPSHDILPFLFFDNANYNLPRGFVNLGGSLLQRGAFLGHWPGLPAQSTAQRLGDLDLLLGCSTLARSTHTLGRMPWTATPRRASGSAMRPVPMPSSRARPPPASPARTLDNRVHDVRFEHSRVRLIVRRRVTLSEVAVLIVHGKGPLTVRARFRARHHTGSAWC
jgi:hypothetical protein